MVTDALAEKVLLERTPGGQQRAVGVTYLAGHHLYQASPDAPSLTESQRASRRRTIRARKEVILAGGCFNSPQLLMLSGIGPASHLRSVGIEPKVDLPAVGTNFQDRHEATTVIEMDTAFSALDDYDLTGAEDDPGVAKWEKLTKFSVYGSNGAPFFIRRRYSKGPRRAEIALLGVLGEFYNFRPGWVDVSLGKPSNKFTWITVKAYSQSRTGTVRLRSADPTATPAINKRSFDDGRGGAYDVGAVKEGIETARRINRRSKIRYEEIAPGPNADLDSYIRKEQFGHHGSCTNPIGASNDPAARPCSTPSTGCVAPPGCGWSTRRPSGRSRGASSGPRWRSCPSVRRRRSSRTPGLIRRLRAFPPLARSPRRARPWSGHAPARPLAPRARSPDGPVLRVAPRPATRRAGSRTWVTPQLPGRCPSRCARQPGRLRTGLGQSRPGAAWLPAESSATSGTTSAIDSHTRVGRKG